MKRHISPLSRHLSDAYKDVRGVKVTMKEGRYVLHRPCCLLYTDASMAKRKKYPKLPNGYGQIGFLGKGRRNPYGVYPPATEVDDIGRPKTPKALCYVPDWLTGFAVLTSYRAGTYQAGDERSLQVRPGESADLNSMVQRLLSDYNQSQGIAKEGEEERGKTFKEVFELYYEKKHKAPYGHSGKKKATERNISRTGYMDTERWMICARRLKRFQVRIYEAVSSLLQTCFFHF